MTDPIEQRVAQLETAVGSLARSPAPQSQVTVRQSITPRQPFMQVGWLATDETITTSAASTGGFIQHRLADVPSDAVAVIVEAYGATAALGGRPTVTVKWKAELNTAEINVLKFKASSVAGDASGYGGLMLPISGGAFCYEVSSDWDAVELRVIGFLSVRS